MAEDKACTITLEDGTHYDLSSLASASSDYTADAGADKNEYKLNVCRAVVSELWGIEETDKVAGVIKRPSEGDAGSRQVSTNITLSPGTKEPMLLLENGSKCPGNENERASTAIRFVCQQSEFGAGKPRLVAALPAGDNSCHFFFDWPTHVACATSPQAELASGHLIAFGAFIAVALLTWFGGHSLYNRFYLGRRGLDQFPLPRFSAPKLSLPTVGRRSDAPAAPPRRWSLFKGRRSQRNGYSHVRADDGGEEDRLAGARFSLDDSDDEYQYDDQDARAINSELNAWRTSPRQSTERANGRPEPTVGVHQGLVDI
ncbi:hypothetical protein VHUM_01671 [Vanrija humicola]|uniref:MRH domain-containing protein n=1 Tax=Vanrija humicola TaxID=5417 RepID=A0A7D8Z4M1_VANHU|nr:hypothetical protein VHUM_01671 [Vanrija humicola]